jgi:phosphoglycolate phosphatase
MLADYSAHSLVKTRPYDGVREVLRALGELRLPLAVFSNKSHDLTRRIVETLLGQALFAEVRGAQPGIPLKPDPAVALELAAGLGVEPGLVAYVGDSSVDMQTAVAAGMPAVGVSWGFRTAAELREHGAAVVIDRPDELLALRG